MSRFCDLLGQLPDLSICYYMQPWSNIDNQLSFLLHITKLTHSWWFFPYNNRSIQQLLSTDASHMLVQSLFISRLDYCSTLLAGLLYMCAPSSFSIWSRLQQHDLLSASPISHTWPASYICPHQILNIDALPTATPLRLSPTMEDMNEGSSLSW